MTAPFLHPDRLFPADPSTRAIARCLFAEVEHQPIVSPHGHTEPGWFAENAPFPDPSTLFVKPDHYVFRMLYSQGVALEDLGVPRADGGPVETDSRKIWRLFAKHWPLFRGTPSRMWIEYAFSRNFGIDETLTEANADRLHDRIAEQLATPAFLPRALFDRFNIEALASTDAALDPLNAHAAIRASGWKGRVIPTYRPDAVVDPEFPGFAANLDRLGEMTGCDTMTLSGYLDAHRQRRAFFKSMGATATDHGHPTAATATLAKAEAEALFVRVRSGKASAADAELFRAYMVVELAGMSAQDGLVMQLHVGSWRNHSDSLFGRFGRDKGADIPAPTNFVRDLKPLLDRHGCDPKLTIILFTLDETTYSRELAPLAGVYPALRLGPPWWFFDAPEGMRRFRELVTETAGFANTVGFNDDTRAFLSIPARHDMARRMDCGFLARLVAEHRMSEADAHELAMDLTTGLVRQAYRL